MGFSGPPGSSSFETALCQGCSEKRSVQLAVHSPLTCNVLARVQGAPCFEDTGEFRFPYHIHPQTSISLLDAGKPEYKPSVPSLLEQETGNSSAGI